LNEIYSENSVKGSQGPISFEGIEELNPPSYTLEGKKIMEHGGGSKLFDGERLFKSGGRKQLPRRC
jgi:hypothetical protein